ncbi:MAG: hypothetical protein ACFFDR_06505, partial [Candidatus Thorarchaeota archaeon]
MRNLLGGIIGSIVGASYISYALMLPQLLWPESVSSITFILEGSFRLMLYVVQAPFDYIISWLAA